jgi:hypothetical protein
MDREKILEDFEYVVRKSHGEGWDYVDGLATEDGFKILQLLKEQEAVKPKRINGKRNRFIKCGNCNYDLMTGFQFCPHCGREVKRDD